ncbi:MAG: AraC family transcriptional regulator [Bdellovibrionaceae bacterium]|nr:AraC family transcriptional regulator [Bdellovibrionales bacterium]MCB9083039.1 AraC family transcriptional regulator [Pseudobdellovibrionaceae bacterium]
MEFDQRFEQSQIRIFFWILPLISLLALVQVTIMLTTGNVIVPVLWANIALLCSNLVGLFFCIQGRLSVVAFLFKTTLGLAFLTVSLIFPNPIVLRWVPVVFMVFALFVGRDTYKLYGFLGALAPTLGLLSQRFLLGRPFSDFGLIMEVEVGAVLMAPWISFAFGSLLVQQRERLARSLAQSVFVDQAANSQKKDSADLRVVKETNPQEATPRYQFSTLTPAEMEKIAEQAISYFEGSDDILDPNFKLGRLSKALSVPKHHLSQVLSLSLQRSFYDLLNEYRIEEVKRRLKDPSYDGQTIIDIAYGVGFNSKSTFNTAFKRLVGMTPSAYRESRTSRDRDLDS